MKKTNKILSLIMAMVLAIISVVCISADDVIVNDEYIAFFENDIAADEFEEELMPLAAGSCITKFDWSNSHHDQHLQNDTSKPIHGVFSQSAYNHLPKLVPSNAYLVNLSGTNYTYTYKFNNAGIQGGYAGNGMVLNRIIIVTSGASAQVVTAYPY